MTHRFKSTKVSPRGPAGAFGILALAAGLFAFTGAVEAQTISSNNDQSFTVGDDPTAAATITITDDAGTPTITKNGKLRIRIPSSFPMSWDTTVATVTIGGPAAGKMKTKLKSFPTNPL